MEPADLMVPVAPGVRLHVRHWPGDPATAAFVLVHGLSSNARLWDGTAARLSAAGHQSYAVDLRSHGESERPPDGYDTDTAAADVAALIAGLALPAPVVAGQSWGGNVTVALAAKNPSGVRAVALLDGGWIDLRRQFESWEACASALRPADIDGSPAAELASQVRRAHPDWAEWAIEATLANFAVDPSGRITRRLPIPQHMSILHSMWEHPPAPLFGSVTVPALLVPTRRSGLVAEAVAAMPAATVREYAGADHDLHAQHPRRLAADLLLLASSAT